MELYETQMNAKDLNQQGVMLFRTGNIDAAVDKYNKAIEIDPMTIESYMNLGNLYLRTEKYQEAKNYYKKALLIEKKGEVYFQYGNACFLNDEPHEGLEYYNLALSAGFDSDEMFFFMGMAYEHMNDDQMALRYVQKAISKNPSRPDYKVKKISILLRLDMIDEAKKGIDQLLLDDPELYDGYHMKIAVLLEEKQYGQAIEFAKKATERFPEDADLMYDYANANALAKKYDRTLEIVNNAEKMEFFEEAKPKFLLLEAEVLAEMTKLDDAIEKCDECISLETDGIFPEARFTRINLAMVKQDYESALANSIKIIESDIRDSYYFASVYYRALCTQKLGKKEDAEQLYKEAISLYRLFTLQNPEAIDAYLYRAMCLRDIEKYDEALEILDFIDNLNCDIAEVFTIRADIYKAKGNDSLAKEELEKACSIKPELKQLYIKDGE